MVQVQLTHAHAQQLGVMLRLLCVHPGRQSHDLCHTFKVVYFVVVGNALVNRLARQCNIALAQPDQPQVDQLNVDAV